MHLSIEWLPATRPAPQLLILLHDRGGRGADMRPLAIALREAFPQAAVLAPDAPGQPPDAGAWCADDADPYAALPPLQRWIVQQQTRLGIASQATALAGLGQGATVALALSCASDGLAGRVLAFGAQVAELPDRAPELTTWHLLHGTDDDQAPVQGARLALTHFGAVQGDATLDIAQGVGHGLHPALIDSALFRLRNHIPHRTWRAALGAVPPRPTDADTPS